MSPKLGIFKDQERYINIISSLLQFYTLWEKNVVLLWGGALESRTPPLSASQSYKADRACSH